MVGVVVAGAINQDINLFVKKLPKAGEEIPVLRITRVPGGKAGNVSVAAARLLGPHQVAIIGALGRDAIADTQIQLLNSEGVDTSAISLKPDFESGQAYIAIEESGQNTIHTHFGANAMLTSTEVGGDRVRRVIESARITTITDPPEETLETITEIANAAGRLIAWDPGVRAQAGIQRLRRMLLHTHYIFLNEVEVEYMTGVADYAEAAKRLWLINPNLTSILKLGKEGCTMFKGQATIRLAGIDLAKYGLRVVNTVGCGDAFLGAFSAAKALSLSDEEALHWANWAGAMKATKPETRGSPTRSDLENWMARSRTGENL